MGKMWATNRIWKKLPSPAWVCKSVVAVPCKETTIAEAFATSTGLVDEVHDVRIILVLRDISRIAHDVLQQEYVERMQ